MADEKNEKFAPQHEVHDAHSPEQSVNVDDLVLPPGWRYRSPRLFGKRLPWYASPEFQILLVALVCFLCPGMFNAVNGLGGAGQEDHRTADAQNTAVYATFSVIGFFAGTIVNRIGVKLALSLSGFAYTIYVASYLCYNHTQNFGFCIFAGVLLGCCAGVLWSAQGVIMLSYPPENKKGRYIAFFWVVFNLGGVVGSLIPLGQNIHATVQKTVSDGTYIGFIVLTFCGALLAWTLARADSVIRRDGSKIILMKNPTWKTEILGLYETLKTDSYVILLFPMFFASNWFYTYQFNDFNGAKFDLRTSSLNNVLYWTSQMIGAAIAGSLLDLTYFRRTVRAKAAWVILFSLTMIIWGGGYAFQDYTRADVGKIYDWNMSGYIGPMFLYMFYGAYDAIWQTCVYWFMGAITNNGRKLANFAGFYKGIQSAGAAIVWRLDGLDDPPPYINMFASSWALLAASLLIALPVMIIKIKDTVTVEEDLKFSDETIDDVYVQKEIDQTAELKV